MVHKFFNKKEAPVQHDIFHLDGEKTLPGQVLHTADDNGWKDDQRGTEVRSQFLHKHNMDELGDDIDWKRDGMGKIRRRNITLNEHEAQG